MTRSLINSEYISLNSIVLSPEYTNLRPLIESTFRTEYLYNFNSFATQITQICNEHVHS